MAHEKEIRVMVDVLTALNDGSPYLSFCDVKKLLGCGKNNVAGILHELGIGAKRVGKRKRISVYSLAEAMCQNRIAPINND